MSCVECGDEPAQYARVVYLDRDAETLRLCADCIREFQNADFVTEITPVDPDSMD